MNKVVNKVKDRFFVQKRIDNQVIKQIQNSLGLNTLQEILIMETLLKRND